MSAFPTTVKPTLGFGKKTETGIIEAQFGDKYTQRSSDGINTIFDTLSLEWACLDSTAYWEMIDFLEDAGGVESFTFLAPGERVTKKYLCKQWDTSHIGNSKYGLTADFLQVFDL